ncbi:MAG: hypothetical protein BroJett003_11370 [Planctomycetota bacterium]|nr:MAG: hypothetical protein BroJett003_11370 [Planctomycetota bacterium]
MLKGQPEQSSSTDYPVVAGGRFSPALRITRGEGLGRRIPCRRIVTLVGSRPGCKINLQHPAVAPVHLALVHTGSRWLACDLATLRGTRHNDLPLRVDEVLDGSVLTLGPWEFRVEIAPPDAEAPEAEIDLDASPGDPTLEHLGTRRLFQPARDVCLIGRRSGCDIAIEDEEVSRVHAILFKHHDRAVIADVLASVPLRINGEPRRFAHLHQDDVIEVGRTQFRVRFPRGVHAATPGGNGIAASSATSQETAAKETDLVDIRAAEGKHWPVADRLERLRKDSMPSGS